MRLLPVLSLMLCSLTASAAFATLPTAAETQDLARSKACLNCHQIDHKVIGPAFKDVAGRVSLITATKMVLLPAVALGTAVLLGVQNPDYWGALALFVLVPSGVGCFVIVSQYGVYKSETAAAIAFTMMLSVLTVSGVLVVFG
mgnify:CR=1 FL=1